MTPVRYLPVLCIAFLSLATPAETVPAYDLPVEAGSPLISEKSARIQMARMLQKDARAQEAIAEYRKLLADDPSLLPARIELAGLLTAQNQPAEARKLLESIPVEKLDRDGLNILASIYETEGRFPDAEKIYEEILKASPGDQIARFRLSQVLSWQKKYPEAVRILQTLVQERPTDIQLLRHYAQILGWAGRTKESLEIWKKTLPARH